jgi:hypothetical protein
MKKRSAILLSGVLFSFLLFSCGEETKNENVSSTTGNSAKTFPKGVKTGIGATGFTIDLPATHKMEEHKGPDFVVYYINSIDTTYNKGSAGIYFGSAPDGHGPPNIVSKEESDGMLFGKPSKNVKYITPTYTWFESVVDEGERLKIQTWYFAYNEAELNELRQMMNTITRK